jgi:hypothetical protein
MLYDGQVRILSQAKMTGPGAQTLTAHSGALRRNGTGMAVFHGKRLQS